MFFLYTGILQSLHYTPFISLRYVLFNKLQLKNLKFKKEMSSQNIKI